MLMMNCLQILSHAWKLFLIFACEFPIPLVTSALVNSLNLNRIKRQNQFFTPYELPGPIQPLPGKSAFGNYWPLFPLSAQYSMGLDIDSNSEKSNGAHVEMPILGWGMFTLDAKFRIRVQDTVTNFGMQTQPVNMMGFSPNQLAHIISNQRYHVYRDQQPRLPIANLPRSFVPMSCYPSLCNPFVHNFGFGFEQEFGGPDGDLGELIFPIPVAKRIAYSFPLSGGLFYDTDNVTVTYGQNMPNVNPFGYRNKRSSLWTKLW